MPTVSGYNRQPSVTSIALITGGSTPERNVALAGAGEVAAALRHKAYAVVVIDTYHGVLDAAQEATILDSSVGLEPPDEEELESIAAAEDLVATVRLEEVRASDLVFLVLHGRQGEGGLVQALLEAEGIAFVGSDSGASFLAMDKDVSKRLLRAAGVATPDWEMWPADGAAIDSLGLPLVVKPSRVGSTVGLTIVYRRQDVQAAVELALRYDSEVLLERFVDGREITIGVLGDEPLAVGEILPENEVFDYECKYTPGMCEEVFPAPIDDSLASRARELALVAHRTLKLRDLSRVDFRIDGHGELWCLEVNTLPGVTSTSLLPQSGAAAGVPFAELCDRVCELALRRSS
ncbi:MAG: D-alanine--D-alanine ligase [Acidobacteriota bacterium]|nr:D-alanine--D-alanine ligase [Acidobacteriota bacterium]